MTQTPGLRFESIWNDFRGRLPTRMGLPAESESDTQTVSASIGVQRGPLGATTTLTCVGEMRDVAGQGSIPSNERIDNYFVADLTAHWDFSERGRLYLGIDNVADNEYMVSRRPFGARPGLPFMVLGGIKYTLGG